MDPVMQSDQSRHLERLALEELDVVNRQLAEAGRTIDELRSDLLALAARLDDGRSHAESLKDQLKQERADSDALRAAVPALEAHVARLKRQLNSPARLVVKKALKRGPYAPPDAS